MLVFADIKISEKRAAVRAAMVAGKTGAQMRREFGATIGQITRIRHWVNKFEPISATEPANLATKPKPKRPHALGNKSCRGIVPGKSLSRAAYCGQRTIKDSNFCALHQSQGRIPRHLMSPKFQERNYSNG